MKNKHIKLFETFIMNEGKVPKVERNILLRDKNYILIEPLTQRASCKYGAFTKWCSANPERLKDKPGDHGHWDRNTQNMQLLYLIDRYENIDEQDIDDKRRFASISNRIEGGGREDLDEDDLEFYDENSDDMDMYNFEKIAFSKNYSDDKIKIWDKNNASFSGYNFEDNTIDDLPIDEYVKDIIKKYFRV